jgi:hypothetical protein
VALGNGALVGAKGLKKEKAGLIGMAGGSEEKGAALGLLYCEGGGGSGCVRVVDEGVGSRGWSAMSEMRGSGVRLRFGIPVSILVWLRGKIGSWAS